MIKRYALNTGLRGSTTPQPPRPTSDRFNYYDLHPQMRDKSKPERKTLINMIHDWLATNGPSTAHRIAEGIHSNNQIVSAAIRTSNDGSVVDSGKTEGIGRNKAKVWAVARKRG